MGAQGPYQDSGNVYNQVLRYHIHELNRDKFSTLFLPYLTRHSNEPKGMNFHRLEPKLGPSTRGLRMRMGEGTHSLEQDGSPRVSGPTLSEDVPLYSSTVLDQCPPGSHVPSFDRVGLEPRICPVQSTLHRTLHDLTERKGWDPWTVQGPRLPGLSTTGRREYLGCHDRTGDVTATRDPRYVGPNVQSPSSCQATDPLLYKRTGNIPLARDKRGRTLTMVDKGR